MDFLLLRPEIQEFINQNIGADSTKLALKKNPFPDVNWPEVINQISAKTKAKGKLPIWFNAENILFPSKISLEQTSSEKTARYKAELISGESLIDLTGGFGIDCFFFSKKVQTVVHCEQNEDLSAIVKHNFEQLSANNIYCISGDSTEILKTSGHFDWIYIDPSRRNDAKVKVFMLKDCFPNVPELLNLYFSHSEKILIKTAPILDISAGLLELQNVKSIHIIAVDNEVRELVWELRKGYSETVEIKTVNLRDQKRDYFDFEFNTTEIALIGLPKKYLYEPNAAIMKSGGFDAIATRYSLEKLHRHSHLYTSDELIDFPGRRFEIGQILSYDKAYMKTLEGKKMNVTARNFPESVENIRKKWKLKDGGTDYCFFTTDANNHKIVLLCTKI